MQKNFYRLSVLSLLAVFLVGCSLLGGKGGTTPETPPYHISGYVQTEDGAGVDNVLLLFSGEHGIAETDQSGRWSKANLEGDVHIIPTKEGWRFTPPVMGVRSERADLVFTAAPHGPEGRLEAFAAADKLWIRLNERGPDGRSTFYIKTGQSDGYSHHYWQNQVVNYMAEKDTLYKYDESGRVTARGRVDTYTMGEIEIVAVDLALLGRVVSGALAVGYTDNRGSFVPQSRSSMLEVEILEAEPIGAATFYPVEYDGILNNPFKGWAPDAKGGPYRQDHRLVRTEMLWSEIEPRQGIFDWAAFEAMNKFDYWEEKGVAHIIRFRMDVPSTRGRAQMQIPQWLYDLIDGDGTWYDTTEIGRGFSPNYSNPILIAEHERFLQEFGARYNNDPRVAFIQLGSVGHWGEWHTWPTGSGEFPPEEVANQYMRHYVENLDQKMLGIRRPFAYATQNNFGYFNDRIGHTPTTDQWLFWINNGMHYENWYDGRSYPETAVPDFWQTSYSAGEFGSGNALLWLGDGEIEETLRQVKLSHTSWIGPCTPANVRNDAPELANVQRLLKTIGYRFVIESVTHQDTVNGGEALAIQMVWNNKGVAPFYFPWPVEVGLARSNGDLALWSLSDLDIRGLLPGEHGTSFELEIPADFAPGSYSLVVAILDPDTGLPGVDLAIEGRRPDGRYKLSEIVIQ